jgi:histidinol phosphatase-like enzyme
VEFTPGALEALFKVGQAGWNLYLIGNEDAVAFGKMSATSWEALESALLDHLRGHGILIQRNYACLDHPEGKSPHDKDSVFLLPNTGTLYHAAQTDGIALRESWVIGDSTLELVAGWRASCRLAAVRTGLALEDGGLQVEPEIFADNLATVLHEIESGERMTRC